ncbi:MAG: toll/interleukin-1 receptor domain-containing protein [Anaerolineales bacterium]
MTAFISYSRDNSDFAVRLAKDLRMAGYDIWLDQLDIHTGARWDDEVEKALEKSTTFLMILTPESIQSQNVKDEVGYAIDNGKYILPVLLKPCKIPFRLRRFQFVDFTNQPYQESLTEIQDLLSNTNANQPATAGDIEEGASEADRIFLIPYIYGRPVRPKEFLGRSTELRAVFNRLRNSESTAVVGDPHIGKTSFLLKVADPETQKEYLGSDVESMFFASLDLHSIGNDYDVRAFWEEALYGFKESPGNHNTSRLLEKATTSGYARSDLDRLFTYLGQSNRRLVLLLDEFERLLNHRNFQDAAFFALLRSLATRTGGLSLITASRIGVAAMNLIGRGLLDTGSPFFNNVIEIRLRPLSDTDIVVLLSRAGDALSLSDQRFVCRLAGRNPFLLQAMCGTLIDTQGENRQAQAAESFYDRIAFHFDDLWQTMDDPTRTTAVILSLVELGGRVLGSDFSYGEIEKVDAFGPELRKLAGRGLVEQVGEGWKFDTEHLLLWRGERWSVSAQVFTWWVRDVVMLGTRQLPSYDDWLENKRYSFLLTQEQWDGLSHVAQKVPDWAVKGVAGLAKSLFEEIILKTRL